MNTLRYINVLFKKQADLRKRVARLEYENAELKAAFIELCDVLEVKYGKQKETDEGSQNKVRLQKKSKVERLQKKEV